MTVIRYWPVINYQDGAELGPCPGCMNEGAYISTQMEIDGIPFTHPQGFVGCTWCDLKLPLEEMPDGEGE